MTSVDLSRCINLSEISVSFEECNSINDIKIDNDYYHVEQLGPKGKAVIRGKRRTTSWNDSSNVVGSLACGDIVIPDNITSIADNTFYNCSSINSVSFPSSLQTIGNAAFIRSGLTSADLSRCINLSVINNYVFGNCTRLTSVSFPSSLRTINSLAFRNSSSLNYIAWDLPTNYTNITIKNDVFLDISSTGKVKSLNPSINSGDFLTWIKTKGNFPSSGWEAEA